MEILPCGSYSSHKSHIHGLVIDEGVNERCQDFIHLKNKGIQKRIWGSSHLMLHLDHHSSQIFHENKDNSLKITVKTLTEDQMVSKLGQIKCGILNESSAGPDKMGEAHREAHPWVGRLLSAKNGKEVYSCGAVLIGPRLALTAACSLY